MQPAYKQTYKDRHTSKHTKADVQATIQTNIQRQTYKQPSKQTYKDRHTSKHTKTDVQATIQTNIQRQTYKQTYKDRRSCIKTEEEKTKNPPKKLKTPFRAFSTSTVSNLRSHFRLLPFPLKFLPSLHQGAASQSHPHTPSYP